jgi:hypothetical protein
MFLYAQMAELVDALVSGTSEACFVEVRVLFWAPYKFALNINLRC